MDACAAEAVAKLRVAPSRVEIARSGSVRTSLTRDDIARLRREDLLSLRSVEHIYAEVMIDTIPGLSRAGGGGGGGGGCGSGSGSGGLAERHDAESGMLALQKSIIAISPSRWAACLHVWDKVFRGASYFRNASAEALRFKVLKKRSGSHAFSSTQLAQVGVLRSSTLTGPQTLTVTRA